MRDGVATVYEIRELYSDGPAYRVAAVRFEDGRPDVAVVIGPITGGVQ